MDAGEALSDLKAIATQVEHAILFEDEGEVVASTLGDDGRSGAVARAASRLLAASAKAAPGGTVVQLEAALEEASVVVVRDEQRAIVAVTRPRPTIGLVFYDLRACLREVGEPPQKKRGSRGTKEEAEAND